MICPRKFYKAHYVVTYSFVMQGVFMGVSDIMMGVQQSSVTVGCQQGTRG